MELVVDITVNYQKETEAAFIQEISKEDNEMLVDYVEEVLEMERIDDSRPLYISLLLTDNEEIQTINRDFRGKDAPTDVISFAYHETEEEIMNPTDVLGDIIISIDRVAEQAKDYNHSFHREFFYVLTHGILHILGYDHIEEDDKAEMREREEEILAHFGYTRDCL